MRSPVRNAVAMATAAAGLAVATAVAGCGLSDPAAGAEEGVQTVRLTIRHSRFVPSTVTVQPGATVRFVVRNTDPIDHELIVGDEEVQDRHERGTEAHHGDRPGEVSVPAGSTAETTFRVSAERPPGSRLLLGCHLPGHWAYGMRGSLVVEG